MTKSDPFSAAATNDDLFSQRLALAIQHDPAGRGIARLEAALPARAAMELAAIAADFRGRSAGAVALVTGFCIADAPRPAAETDGPPGTLFLAQMLAELGWRVTLVSDEFGRPLLEAGCDFLGMPRDWVATMPLEVIDDNAETAGGGGSSNGSRKADAWIESFLASPHGIDLTHLIAIERVGPSHTLESIRAQSPENAAIIAEFEHAVPPEHRNVCHNMRGRPIDAWTAKTHRLFEIAGARLPGCVSMGIGDGGNEIGSGAIPWALARDAIAGGQGAQIACRVRTDHFLLAGISDWGAYALAATLAHALGRRDLVDLFDRSRQRELVEAIVRETDAIDGMTRQRQATVDGLALDEYLRPFTAMRELLAT